MHSFLRTYIKYNICRKYFAKQHTSGIGLLLMLLITTPLTSSLAPMVQLLTYIFVLYLSTAIKSLDYKFFNTFDSGIDDDFAKVTIKFIQGIAVKAWLVSFKWVSNNLQADKVLPEVNNTKL